MPESNTSASKHLPTFDVVIHGNSGRESIVSGTRPEPGENLAQMLKRLHPRLSSSEIAYEVRQTLKYNKDYGNDLGDGSHLDSHQTVYLTSVESKDADGRVTEIDSPNGRTIEISYDVSGVAAYTIHEASDRPGTVSQTVSKNHNGQWLQTNADGSQSVLADVVVDSAGDLIVTTTGDERVAHLTCGDDVYTEMQDKKPVSGHATRDGQQISTYNYDYSRNETTVTYTDSHKTVAVGEDLSSPESIGEPTTTDISPDSYASKVIDAARSLLGQNGTAYGVDPRHACALFVRTVLHAVGFHSTVLDDNCDNLVDDLRSQGYVEVPVSQKQPGDIIMGTNNEHTAIYEGNGKILANSTNQQEFVEQNYADVFCGYLGESVTIWHKP